MRMPQLFFALIAVLWLWTGAAVGQSSALGDAFKRYEALNDEGRFKEAFPFAK